MKENEVILLQVSVLTSVVVLDSALNEARFIYSNPSSNSPYHYSPGVCNRSNMQGIQFTLSLFTVLSSLVQVISFWKNRLHALRYNWCSRWPAETQLRAYLTTVVMIIVNTV